MQTLFQSNTKRIHNKGLQYGLRSQIPRIPSYLMAQSNWKCPTIPTYDQKTNRQKQLCSLCFSLFCEIPNHRSHISENSPTMHAAWVPRETSQEVCVEGNVLDKESCLGILWRELITDSAVWETRPQQGRCGTEWDHPTQQTQSGHANSQVCIQDYGQVVDSGSTLVTPSPIVLVTQWTTKSPPPPFSAYFTETSLILEKLDGYVPAALNRLRMACLHHKQNPSEHPLDWQISIHISRDISTGLYFSSPNICSHE